MDAFITIILALMAAVCSAYAIVKAITGHFQRKRCTASTRGEVVEVITEGGGRNYSYYLKVRFEANGHTYLVRESGDCSPSRFYAGMPVDICYDPAEPRNFYVSANTRYRLNLIIIVVVSAALLLILGAAALGIIH